MKKQSILLLIFALAFASVYDAQARGGGRGGGGRGGGGHRAGGGGRHSGSARTHGGRSYHGGGRGYRHGGYYGRRGYYGGRGWYGGWGWGAPLWGAGLGFTLGYSYGYRNPYYWPGYWYRPRWYWNPNYYVGFTYTDYAQGKNLLQALQSNRSDFSIFLDGLRKTGLDRELTRPSMTVLAPTNSAFRAIKGLDQLMNNTEALRAILSHHIIQGNIRRIEDYRGKPIDTLNGSVSVEGNPSDRSTKERPAVVLDEQANVLYAQRVGNSTLYAIDALLLDKESMKQQQQSSENRSAVNYNDNSNSNNADDNNSNDFDDEYYE